MEIRLASETDRNVLIRDYLQQVYPDLEMAQRYAEQHLRLDRALLLEEEADVVGTLNWGMRGLPRDGMAELTGLRLNPSQRGQGKGKFLLEAGLADMRAYFAERGAELNCVYGWLNREQAVCRAFLEGAGFQIREGLAGGWLAVRASSPS
ncbi:MAG: GNAT family N-acetyltransferase [Tumebacillaceae bacterium]